jgi:hypothetical protein
MNRLIAIVALSAVSTLARADAQSSTTQSTIVFSGTLFDACTGEHVTLDGDLHLVTHDTVDANGGHHAKVGVNTQGLSGTGTSGASYHLISVGEVNVETTSGASETTEVSHFKLVGSGPSDNQYFDFLLHFTVDANGDLTADTASIASGCR